LGTPFCGVLGLVVVAVVLEDVAWRAVELAGGVACCVVVTGVDAGVVGVAAMAGTVIATAATEARAKARVRTLVIRAVSSARRMPSLDGPDGAPATLRPHRAHLEIL
jgi:hypothetical protein